MLVAFEPCGATRVRVLGVRMGAALAAADEVAPLPVRDEVPTGAGAVSAEGIREILLTAPDEWSAHCAGLTAPWGSSKPDRRGRSAVLPQEGVSIGVDRCR